MRSIPAPARSPGDAQSQAHRTKMFERPPSGERYEVRLEAHPPRGPCNRTKWKGRPAHPLFIP